MATGHEPCRADNSAGSFHSMPTTTVKADSDHETGLRVTQVSRPASACSVPGSLAGAGINHQWPDPCESLWSENECALLCAGPHTALAQIVRSACNSDMILCVRDPLSRRLPASAGVLHQTIIIDDLQFTRYRRSLAGLMFQISRAYSEIVRSLENLPILAVFRMAFSVQRERLQ